MHALLAAVTLLGVVCLSQHARAQPGQGALRDPYPMRAPVPTEELLDKGLSLFKARRFAAAAALLERARARDPGDVDVLLLLGIAYYRTGDNGRAEPLLKRAARAGDQEAQASARLFLGLIYQSQGAADRARAELESASHAEGLGAAARGLAEGAAPHRLFGSLALSLEYDGNVPLTDYATWVKQPADSGDGDMLLVGSVSTRPWRRIGLSVGDTLSYRQQFRGDMQSYNLLLNSTWLGYSYLGESDRVRATTTLTYAMLGQASLYLDFEGKVSYRRRLWAKLGLGLTYTGHYRSYALADYAAFTGQTHGLLLEGSWGLFPEPVSVSVGYQALREQLDQDIFRAWAHGPTLRARARVHRLLELQLFATGLQRRFDLVPPAPGVQRQDFYLLTDLSLTVECTPWLDAFAGAMIIYNYSNDPAFMYMKPLGYLGVAASFSAL